MIERDITPTIPQNELGNHVRRGLREFENYLLDLQDQGVLKAGPILDQIKVILNKDMQRQISPQQI